MASLSCKKTLRLFAVSESPNEANGMYGLEAFNDTSFNQVFDETEINEKLDDLLNHLFGGGQWFEVTDDEYGPDGNLCFSIDDDNLLEINDLTEKIDCDPEKSTYYVLIDQEYSERRWVVAERQGFVYSDLD